MVTIKQLEDALIEADKAGNTEDATALANEIAAIRQKGTNLRETPVAELPNEVQVIREVMRDPKTSGVERLGMIAPYLYYTGKDAMASMGIRGASPALGQVAGQRFGGKPGAIIGGAAGGALGSAADQARLMMQGKQKDFSFGQLAGDTLAGANPVRGQVGNVIGNVGAANLESYIDTGKPASMERNMLAASGAMVGATASKGLTGKTLTPEEVLYKERLDAWKDIRKSGYDVVIAPQEIGRGSSTLSSIGGKAAMGQEASKLNQYQWQRMGREDLGLSKEARPFRPTKITETGKVVPGELDEVIKSAYEPYETIKKISSTAKEGAASVLKDKGGHELAIQMDTPETRKLITEAAADVDALKTARIAERQAFTRLKANEPGAYDAWVGAKAKVKDLDDKITAAAESAGDPKLVERLAASRKKIAMAYAYMNATDKTTGLIDLKDLAKQLNDDVFLTGNARKMANFHNAFSRNAVEGVRTPSPDVDGMSSNLAAVSAAQGGPAAAAAMWFPEIRKPVRDIQFSDFAQDQFAQPQYQPNPENFAAALARFAPQAAGREQNLPEDISFLRYMQNPAPFLFGR